VLNLRQIECFVSAVDAGTMTGAAERLRLSQSAVSLAISGLERAVGTQLLCFREAPRGDIAEVRRAAHKPLCDRLLFTRPDGGPWREADYRNWRRRHL
jgi:hypothetical protein